MRKIRVPVTWECYGVVEVEVPDNLPKEKAIEIDQEAPTSKSIRI